MVLRREGYKPRLIDSNIDRMLNAFGAICIEGPKWCGKTWTALNHAESLYDVGNMDNDFQNRMLATLDPGYSLKGEIPHLIDEWQEVPKIWDAVRNSVDTTVDKGRYILTGSSTPVYKGILHSGEGRIGSVRMRTMSLFETGDSDGKISLKQIIDGKDGIVSCGDIGLERLIDLCIRGGWPGSLNVDVSNQGMLPKDYIEKAAVSASRLDGVIRNETKMRMLIRSLGRNESTVVSKKTLQRDIKEADDEVLADNTIIEYLDCLARIFLTDDQSAFSPNFRSPIRIGKAPKRHLADPSLAVATMGLNHDKLLADLKTFGFIFESLCIHDLRIYAEADGGKLFHYRDDKNNEIDAIVEDSEGGWSGFEIKLGTSEIDAAAKELLKIKNMFSDSVPPKALCVICGMATAAYMRDDGVYVVPITSLRN